MVTSSGQIIAKSFDRGFHRARGNGKLRLRDARSGAFPVQRNLMRFHCPLGKLRLAHVWRKRFHDSAVRDGTDKIAQCFLIAPYGECPKFSSEGMRIQRIADQAARFFQLAHNLERKNEELWESAKMFERQIRNQGYVPVPGAGLVMSFPRCDWHVGDFKSCGGTKCKKNLF